jgi:hypothetical protein
MEAKSSLQGKENGTNGSLNVKLSEYYRINRSVGVIDRIIELYRSILRTIDVETSFEDTIQVMTTLGCYSSVKTKSELSALYNLRIAELRKGGANG